MTIGWRDYFAGANLLIARAFKVKRSKRRVIMGQRRFYRVLNVTSGTVQALGVTQDDWERLFAEQGLEVTIDAARQADLNTRIERALKSDADTIIAAGGDGTVTA